jgi:excisionase family DNA binding protein
MSDYVVYCRTGRKKGADKMSELLTTKELMARLKVSRDTIYKWRERGMPCMKIGPGERAAVRFDWAKVQEWIKGQAQ